MTPGELDRWVQRPASNALPPLMVPHKQRRAVFVANY